MKVYLVRWFNECIGEYGDYEAPFYGSTSKEKAEAKARERAKAEAKKLFEESKKSAERWSANLEDKISILEYMLNKKPLPVELKFGYRNDERGDIVIIWERDGIKRKCFKLYKLNGKLDIERQIQNFKQMIDECKEEVEKFDIEHATEKYVEDYISITEMEIEE